MTQVPSAPRPLSSELLALQAQWRKLPRAEADRFFAERFGPPFAEHFASLPLHGAPQDLPRPGRLVSVLGFSWQPVALMAAWVKPERMLVLGTTDSLQPLRHGERVLDCIARVSGIPRDAIERVELGEPAETDVYRAVRDFLGRGTGPRGGAFVDPTGGKKSMSAAACLAGFLSGAPLVYVDYATYDAELRVPLAGSEYPRLLANPLHLLGDLERRILGEAFRRGDYQAAGDLAGVLAARLYERREAECLEALSRGYAAWEAFRFEEAEARLREALDLLRSHGAYGRWAWVDVVAPRVSANLNALAGLRRALASAPSLEDGRLCSAALLGAAARAAARGRPAQAVLHLHGAVEHALDLWLLTRFGLDDQHPDYARVQGRLDRTAHQTAWATLVPGALEHGPLQGPLAMADAAALVVGLGGGPIAQRDLGRLRGLSSDRNRSLHGLRREAISDVALQRHTQFAKEVVGRLFEAAGSLEAVLAEQRFPDLPVLA